MYRSLNRVNRFPSTITLFPTSKFEGQLVNLSILKRYEDRDSDGVVFMFYNVLSVNTQIPTKLSLGFGWYVNFYLV